MYSSVKFLSPIVTGGLPAPGLADDVVDVLAVVAGVEVVAGVDAALVLVVCEFELELPQAASASVAATAIRSPRQ
jgi:hypothetical protein